jgi:hypothetical protein
MDYPMSKISIRPEAVEAAFNLHLLRSGGHFEEVRSQSEEKMRADVEEIIATFCEVEGLMMAFDCAGIDDQIVRPDRQRLVGKWRDVGEGR